MKLLFKTRPIILKPLTINIQLQNSHRYIFGKTNLYFPNKIHEIKRSKEK